MDITQSGKMYTVADALSMLTLDKDLMDYLTSKREEWEVFGKMNSHLYRRLLTKLMVDSRLSGEQMFMVYFLFSVVKNRDRVLKAMDAMTAEEKAKPWFAPVLNFINTRVTQYVSDVTKSKKFPAVNIPNCNPGLDVLVYFIMTEPNKWSLLELSRRTTFSQLDLDAELQDYAKEGYKYYWDKVVNKSNNPDAKEANNKIEAPSFKEEYYANSVSDNYKLVDLELKEVEAPDGGYHLEDVLDYAFKLDVNNELNLEVCALKDDLPLEVWNKYIADKAVEGEDIGGALI